MLEPAEIYGSGQKTGKHTFPFFDPIRIFRTLELAEIYGSGHTTGKVHFWFFDPNRMFLQARARWNTRLGSKNLKILCSGFFTRTVYFCTLELAEIYGSGQTAGKLGFPVF